MNTTPRTIDINDWEKFGEGNTADSYFHKSDEGLMLKLYAPFIKPEFAQSELEKTEKVSSLGVRIPRAIEFVICENRYGAIFERIQGKKSISRAIADNPEKLEEYARIAANEARKLHSIECDTSYFPSAKDYYAKAIEENIRMNDERKQKASEILARVPEATTCLHGDLNPGNIIFNKDGEVLFIDVPEFMYGYHMLDFSMTHFMILASPDRIINEGVHMSREMFAQYEDYFLKEYYQTENVKEIKDELFEYAALSAVYLTHLFKYEDPEVFEKILRIFF